jgi:hypothetical protein
LIGALAGDWLGEASRNSRQSFHYRGGFDIAEGLTVTGVVGKAAAR